MPIDNWLTPYLPPLTLQLSPNLWTGIRPFNAGSQAHLILAEEVEEWCRDSLDSYHAIYLQNITLPDCNGASSPVIQFENDTDMLLFLIRWLTWDDDRWPGYPTSY